MAGFIRRFTTFPPLDVITEIEGVVIVDLIPPGIFVGRITGTVCLVGEWPKGPFNTPTIVEGDQTIRDTFGGFSLSVTDPFDFSAGAFTNPYSNGNAFCWLKNKTYRRLVLVRVDVDLAEGCNVQIYNSDGENGVGSIDCDNGGTGVTPADTETFTLDDGVNTAVVFQFNLGTPVTETNTLREVDISAAVDEDDVRDAIVAAVNNAPVLNITAFANGAGIVGLYQDQNGTGGNTAIADTVADAAFAPAAFAGGTGTTRSNSKLTGPLTLLAGTRVRDASAPDVEFALSSDIVLAEGTNVGVAGTAAYDADASSYSVRTISDVPVFSTRNQPEVAVGDVDSVDSTDLFRSSIGAGTSNPNRAVRASTTVGLDSAAANVAVLAPLSTATFDTRYENALQSTLPGLPATDLIETVACARESDAIRTAMGTNAADASSVGTGRHSLHRPPIGTTSATALGASTPGVGANRSDRNFYCYPHFEQRIPELAEQDPNHDIAPSENILLGADAAMSTILSNLPPEENPGQSTQEFRNGGLLTFVRKLEDGLTGTGQPTNFTMDTYKLFKAGGVAALRRDPRLSEWVFQSGVTSVDPSLYPSLATIKRRRMADFIQDSLATIALRFNKKLATGARIDSMIGELTDFLDLLLSEENEAQQRIADYSLDASSGNTTQLAGTGVFVIIIEVQLLDSLDSIVLQTTIGESVTIESTN